jgi:uncharacterized protein (TIGR03084 family)
MREILTDLVKEQQTLDQFLQKINPREWGKPTKAPGWSVKDLVSHLAQFEDLVAEVIEEGVVPDDLIGEAGGFDAFVAQGPAKGKEMRPQDVIEWWRLSRARAMDALWSLDEDDRMAWIGGECSAKLVATYRIMETWAHGLDVWDIWGDDEENPVPETERLAHIAFLAHKLLPLAFERAGETYEPVRIEVMGPDYAKWSFGPEGAPRIKGPAMEFARLAVHRSSLAECEGIVAEGEPAEHALKFVTAYITP